jgi:tRNA pseudouridine55 synthase
VNHFKRNLPKGYGKIGHFGTLDPFADGILLIGIAGACRMNNQIHLDLPKTYSATGILGIQTPSADKETIDAKTHVDDNIKQVLNGLNLETMNHILKEKFIGLYKQIPPAYSASKFEGKALYKWARDGKIIEKEAVTREIFDLEISAINDDKIDFRATVSTGTYIRTLFEDIARCFGTFGYLESLTRTKIGKLTMHSCLKVNQWPGLHENEEYIYNNSVDLFDILKRETLIIDENQAAKFMNGNPVFVDSNLNQDEVFVYNSNKCLLGLARIQNKLVSPILNFPYLKNS